MHLKSKAEQYERCIKIIPCSHGGAGHNVPEAEALEAGGGSAGTMVKIGECGMRNIHDLARRGYGVAGQPDCVIPTS